MAGTRIGRVGAALAVSATLAGCWLQDGGGPENQRWNGWESHLTSENVASLTLDWSIDVGEPPISGPAEPLVSNGLVYVTRNAISASGGQIQGHISVVAVGLDSGQEVWSANTPGTYAPQFYFLGSLGFAGDDLVAHYAVGGSGGGVPLAAAGAARFDPGSGASLGGVGGLFEGPPRSAGGRLVQVQHTDGMNFLSPTRLVVRDVDTDSPQWSATATPTNAAPQFRNPVTNGAWVYVTETYDVHAYAAGGCGAPTCQPAWTHSFTQLPGSPMITPVGDLLVSVAGNLVALDGTSGAEQWRASASGLAASTRDWVYAAVGASAAHANSLVAHPAGGCGSATCEPAWAVSLGEAPVSWPVVAGDVVYVATASGIHLLDAGGCGGSSCSELGFVATPTPVKRLVVAAGRVVTIDAGDVVRAYTVD